MTEDEAPLFLSLLSLARQAMRSENNKSMPFSSLSFLRSFTFCLFVQTNELPYLSPAALMRAGLGVLLSHILTTISSPSSSSSPLSSIVEKTCACIRGLSIHDDVRKEMSSAYDNGKYFLKAPGVVPALTALAGQYSTSPDLASYALSAAKALVTTNEAVQVLSLHGVLPLLLSILQSVPPPSLGLARSAVGVLRNVSADDSKKEAFLSLGGLSALLHLVCQDDYATDATLMEHAMACLAQFSLRSPSHSEKLVQSGAVEVILRAMHTFPQQEGLQRQACLTLRNIAGRCVDLRGVLLDAGAEAALRAAGRLPTVVDEAYGALRDLNCDVQYVKVDVDGSVQPVYEHFGTQGKLNFRPVYDDDHEIEQRVAENARAPFAHDHCDDDGCEHDH